MLAGDKAYGVELEMVGNPSATNCDMAREITAAGVDCRVERYNHSNRTWWKITSDSSIHGPNGESERDL